MNLYKVRSKAKKQNILEDELNVLPLNLHQDNKSFKFRNIFDSDGNKQNNITIQINDYHKYNLSKKRNVIKANSKSEPKVIERDFGEMNKKQMNILFFQQKQKQSINSNKNYGNRTLYNKKNALSFLKPYINFNKRQNYTLQFLKSQLYNQIQTINQNKNNKKNSFIEYNTTFQNQQMKKNIKGEGKIRTEMSNKKINRPKNYCLIRQKFNISQKHKESENWLQPNIISNSSQILMEKHHINQILHLI